MGFFAFLKKKKDSSVIEKTEQEKEIEKETTKEKEIEEDKEEISPAYQKALDYIEEFNKTLENLREYPVNIEDKFEEMKEPEKETKYSNITAKTKLENFNDFVVIDTETTGLRSSSAIIEISAIRFVDMKPVEIFTSLTSTSSKLSDKIIDLTGITNDMLSDKPKFKQIARSLVDFIGKSPIVGHNLPFDIGVIENKGVYFEKNKKYDTLKLAKKILKTPKYKYDKELGFRDIDYNYDYDIDSYSLDDICRYYGIYRDSAHRASSDCLATGYLFIALLDEII